MLHKLKRLSLNERLNYTGPESSIVMDTTLNNLYLQDGVTSGGYPVSVPVTLNGPKTIPRNIPTDYVITNYSSFSTYEVTVGGGVVSRDGPVITITTDGSVSEVVLTVKRDHFTNIINIPLKPIRIEGIAEELAWPLGSRAEYSATLHDDRIYVYGGAWSASTRYNSLWQYDLISETWTELTSGTIPRSGHTSFINNNKLHIVGGRALYEGRNTTVLPVQIYDIATDTWTETAETYPSLLGSTADIITFNNELFFVYSNMVYKLDPVTFEEIPTGISVLSDDSGASRLANIEDVIYVRGGRSALNGLNLTAKVNLNSGISTPLSNPGSERHRDHTFTRLTNSNYIYVIGGGWANATAHTEIYEYDTVNDTWTTLSMGPIQPRSRHRTISWGNALYILGGAVSSSVTTMTQTMWKLS